MDVSNLTDIGNKILASDSQLKIPDTSIFHSTDALSQFFVKKESYSKDRLYGCQSFLTQEEGPATPPKASPYTKGKTQPEISNILALAAETLQNKATPSISSHGLATSFNGRGNQQGVLPLNLATQTLQQATNFVLTQTPFNTPVQPQLFIAGPNTNPAPGMPFQQLLIPLNQHHLPTTANTGTQMAQQYITIPVSLAMGAQPIQIIANPPIIAAGLQPFTMLTGQTLATDQNLCKTVESSSINQAAVMSPVLVSAGATHTMLPAATSQKSSLSHLQLQQHHDVPQGQDSISLQSDLSSQVARFLPSIQSLTSSLSHNAPLSTPSECGVDDHAGSNSADTELETSQMQTDRSSPGTNETLISSTEPGCVIDGIVLDDIKEFAKQFKCRRLSMGLTQTQVGQALSATEGPAYSQSAICRFEKLDITPKSAQKIKPVLERWLLEAEAKHRMGGNSLNGSSFQDRLKKRKRRTSFTPQSVEILTEYFMKNTHPTGTEMTAIANKLGYDREVVRVWFCNKRQAMKNSGKQSKSDLSS